METTAIAATFAERLGTAPERADTIIKIVLTALGRALPADEAADAASQLPADLGDPLRTSSQQPRETDVEVLLADIAERLDTDGDGARDTVGAVLGTLQEALDTGQWTELTNVLPTEIVQLTHV